MRLAAALRARIRATTRSPSCLVKATHSRPSLRNEGLKATDSRPPSPAEFTRPLIRRYGVPATLPCRMIRMLPGFWTTNRRLRTSGADVTCVGALIPDATRRHFTAIRFSGARCVVSGLDDLVADDETGDGL